MKRIETEDPDIFIIGNRYYYRGTPEGFKRQVERALPVTTATPWKEVLRAKNLFLERHEITGKDSRGKSFKQLAPTYIEYRRENLNPKNKNSRKIRQGTFSEIEYIMKYLVRFFGPYRPEEIDEALWEMYCNNQDMDLSNHRRVLNCFL
jgi:hypothetical protein